MVEFGGKRIESVNDNLNVGDFVVVTNTSLQPLIENYFGTGIRLRVAQIRGNEIDLVAAHDYKHGITIAEHFTDPLFEKVKSWNLHSKDIQPVAVRLVNTGDTE